MEWPEGKLNHPMSTRRNATSGLGLGIANLSTWFKTVEPIRLTAQKTPMPRWPRAREPMPMANMRATSGTGVTTNETAFMTGVSHAVRT